MSAPTNRTVNIYINSSAAQTTLESLQKRADKLTDAIQKGEKAGKDMTDSIQKLGSTNRQIEQLNNIISGKMAPTLEMVKARAQELRRELSRMSADAPGYAQKFEEFKKVSAELNKMSAGVNEVSRSMKSAQERVSSFWKDAGKIAIGTLVANTTQGVIEAVGGYISGIVSGNAKLSDSLADVQKATGLSADEVGRLNSALGRLNTRTATSDLREIAIGLGQIGEAATPQAVAAIDKIVVALGDEFGGGAKEITTTLGILRNNLQDIKSADYGADILGLGNALNVLGAEGLATAPVVVDFANRMAGVAGTFKLTSGEILGLSATMQELGINVERGSTAVQKIFQKIASSPENFARVAQIPVKEFIELINTDMLAAFNAVAVGAGKASDKNTVFAQILKDLDADGSGAGEVLSKLSKNQELLANKTQMATAALKGTSSIMSEFETKNNNLAANIDKLGKKINQWFANSTLTEMINKVVSGLASIGEKTRDVTEDFERQKSTVGNLVTNIAPLVERYDELAKNSKRSAEENAEMKSIIQQVTAVMPGAVSQVDQYGNAIAISTSRVREFIQSEKDRLKILNEQAIQTNNKRLKSEESVLKAMKDQYDTFLKTGKLIFTSSSNARGAEGVTQRVASEQEISAFIQKYKDQVSKVNGLKAQIAKDSGDALDSIVAEQERQRQIKWATDPKNNPYLSGLPTTNYNSDEEEERRRKEEERRRKEEERKRKEELKKAQSDNKKDYVDLNAWLAKANDDWSKAADVPFEAATQRFKESIAQQRNAYGQYYAEGIISKERYSEKMKQLEQEEIDGRIAIATSFAPLSVKAQEELEKAKTEKVKQGVAERDALLKSELDQISQFERLIGALQYGAEVAGTLGNGLGAVAGQLAEKENIELRNDEAINRRKRENFQRMLDAKQISQAKFNREVQKMEDEMEEKRKKVQRAQAQRERVLAIMSATIQGVLATISALKYGPIAAVAVGAMVATQIGILAATKIPELANGGMAPGANGGVPQGPSHANGGIALVSNGQKIAEMEGGEPILSRATYANNPEIVNALLRSSMYEGGKRIDIAWMNQNPAQINSSRLMNAMAFNRSFAIGGQLPAAKYAGSGSTAAALIDPKQMELLERLASVLENGIRANVYHNEWEDVNKEKDDLKKLGSAKAA